MRRNTLGALATAIAICWTTTLFSQGSIRADEPLDEDVLVVNLADDGAAQTDETEARPADAPKKVNRVLKVLQEAVRTAQKKEKAIDEAKAADGDKKPAAPPKADDPADKPPAKDVDPFDTKKDNTKKGDSKKDDAKKGEAKKDEAKKDDPPVAPKPPKVNPDVIKFTLSDGSTISGKPSFAEIQVQTDFGTLTIPATKILSITPGLDSQPEVDAKIKTLIENLASEQFSERDAAQKELTTMGPAIRNILRPFTSDKNAERAKRAKAIITLIEEQALESDDEGENITPPLARKDTVVTTRFTVVGKVTPGEFKIGSRFGELTVKLSDIRNAMRETGQAAEVAETVTVSGTYIAGRSYKKAKLRVERGDVVSVRAEGTIVMTPWGSNYRSTPDGNSSQYGWHLSGKIPGGALVAKIGSAAEFKVGSKHKFTAKAAGTLQFGIGMNPSYRNNAFPGEYKVKVRITRAQQ